MSRTFSCNPESGEQRKIVQDEVMKKGIDAFFNEIESQISKIIKDPRQFTPAVHTVKRQAHMVWELQPSDEYISRIEDRQSDFIKGRETGLTPEAQEKVRKLLLAVATELTILHNQTPPARRESTPPPVVSPNETGADGAAGGSGGQGE